MTRCHAVRSSVVVAGSGSTGAVGASTGAGSSAGDGWASASAVCVWPSAPTSLAGGLAGSGVGSTAGGAGSPGPPASGPA